MGELPALAVEPVRRLGVPEGDTIYRTAASIRQWLGGRVLTAVESQVEGLHLETLVGRTVERVEPHGKHLVISFGLHPDRLDDQPVVLHSHMRMSGSWHVYTSTADWQKPKRQANAILIANDRLAVCFNAPIISLLQQREVGRVTSIGQLGPDVLVDPFDVAEVVARARQHRNNDAIGEVLLDQRVVAGIGNIYRCEAMFLEALHPWTRLRQLANEQLEAVVNTASRIMRVNLAKPVGRNFGNGENQPWVYGRNGLPCRKCSAVVQARKQGSQARTAYWCPSCQRV
jgi:endonuclease VIII